MRLSETTWAGATVVCLLLFVGALGYGTLVSLGTDGFGRSESRESLRDYFEVDAKHITFATLAALSRQGKIPNKTVRQAAKKLGIDPSKVDPTAL